MDYQKGAVLIIIFLIVLVVIAVVLGMITILTNEIGILRSAADANTSSANARTGIEKTLYYDNKEIPPGADRGLCDLCNQCPDCNNCTATPLQGNGCNQNQCDNCRVEYDSTLSNGTFRVSATVSPDGVSPVLAINSTGYYNGVERQANYNSSTTGAPTGAPMGTMCDPSVNPSRCIVDPQGGGIITCALESSPCDFVFMCKDQQCAPGNNGSIACDPNAPENPCL